MHLPFFIPLSCEWYGKNGRCIFKYSALVGFRNSLLEKGYFVKPTIFTDVTNNMRIAKEEIFGPVLSIIPFEDEDEAISIVNDTSYGLGNYVQTQDKDKAKRVARKFDKFKLGSEM